MPICRFVQDAQMVKKCHFLYVTTYFIYPSYQMVTYISQEYPSNFFKNEIWLSTSNMLHKKQPSNLSSSNEFSFHGFFLNVFSNSHVDICGKYFLLLGKIIMCLTWSFLKTTTSRPVYFHSCEFLLRCLHDEMLWLIYQTFQKFTFFLLVFSKLVNAI